MSDYVVYRDSDGDDAQLEVLAGVEMNTGVQLGVVFTAESGPESVAVGLDREAVARLHAQLGEWLGASDSCAKPVTRWFAPVYLAQTGLYCRVGREETVAREFAQREVDELRSQQAPGEPPIVLGYRDVPQWQEAR